MHLSDDFFKERLSSGKKITHPNRQSIARYQSPHRRRKTPDSNPVNSAFPPTFLQSRTFLDTTLHGNGQSFLPSSTQQGLKDTSDDMGSFSSDKSLHFYSTDEPTTVQPHNVLNIDEVETRLMKKEDRNIISSRQSKLPTNPISDSSQASMDKSTRFSSPVPSSDNSSTIPESPDDVNHTVLLAEEIRPTDTPPSQLSATDGVNPESDIPTLSMPTFLSSFKDLDEDLTQIASVITPKSRDNEEIREDYNKPRVVVRTTVDRGRATIKRYESPTRRKRVSDLNRTSDTNHKNERQLPEGDRHPFLPHFLKEKTFIHNILHLPHSDPALDSDSIPSDVDKLVPLSADHLSAAQSSPSKEQSEQEQVKSEAFVEASSPADASFSTSLSSPIPEHKSPSLHTSLSPSSRRPSKDESRHSKSISYTFDAAELEQEFPTPFRQPRHDSDSPLSEAVLSIPAFLQSREDNDSGNDGNTEGLEDPAHPDEISRSYQLERNVLRKDHTRRFISPHRKGRRSRDSTTKPTISPKKEDQPSQMWPFSTSFINKRTFLGTDEDATREHVDELRKQREERVKLETTVQTTGGLHMSEKDIRDLQNELKKESEKKNIASEKLHQKRLEHEQIEKDFASHREELSHKRACKLSKANKKVEILTALLLQKEQEVAEAEKTMKAEERQRRLLFERRKSNEAFTQFLMQQSETKAKAGPTQRKNPPATQNVEGVVRENERLRREVHEQQKKIKEMKNKLEMFEAGLWFVGNSEKEQRRRDFERKFKEEERKKREIERVACEIEEQIQLVQSSLTNNLSFMDNHHFTQV
ncbi:hypothetical protein BLNAU_20043 [Blattamonas nauphoetae]|uniref:Uncharacterized protein n=1 Tax=Blattamonas nauphoetae TaxID=2049346 RepID=A0ABQ9WZY3_9EUKA|nr:hypothetical protein BLNAU_20043 [Blattamonas nauphoetae]